MARAGESFNPADAAPALQGAKANYQRPIPLAADQVTIWSRTLRVLVSVGPCNGLYSAKLAEMSHRLMKAATDLAQEGFAVFPCRPGSKLPAVNHWQQWATRDVQTIERKWFDAGYNIGVACGRSRLLVVDCDVKNGAMGDWHYQQWLLDNGLDRVPATLIVRTPSGGSHIIYRRPLGLELGNGTGSLPSGIDVRGMGGYVLGIGSEVDGRRYKRHPKSSDEIGPMPVAIIEALTPRRVDRTELPVRGDLSRYAARALDSELAAVANLGEGGRNEGLFSASRKLGSLLGAGAFSDRLALEEALLAANSQMVSPLDANEALRAITSGLDWGERHPRHLTSVSGLSL